MNKSLNRVTLSEMRMASPGCATKTAKTALDRDNQVVAFRAEPTSRRNRPPVVGKPENPLRPALGDDRVLTAKAMLAGPFRVIASDGSDLTPGSTLRQAILATLICAPRQIKSRKSLQAMFWGEADTARASANLRTAIYQLRQDLANLGPDVLIADRQTIGLAPGRITAADAIIGGASFLEGLDLPLEGCAAFEDFLRDMRLADAESDTKDHPPPAAPGRALLTPSHLALGLLPPVHAGLSRADLHMADGFVDSVVHYLWHTTAMDVHDLRTPDSQLVPLPIASGKGATHWLQATVEKKGARAGLRLGLVEGGTRRLLWLSEAVALRAERSEEVAYGMGELLVDRLTAQKGAATVPDLFPISALAAMFSLDPQTFLQAEAQLQTMLDTDRACVLECLLAFAQVFKVHEGIGTASVLDTGRMCEMLSRIPASDPLLPLCQSLVGYALHMLADDSETALLLIEAAFERTPHLAINLDHLAVLRLIRGDIDRASDAVQHCLRVGAFSPWRYTFEVTGAMVCMARGDFRQSLFHANQALFRQPRYLGALRYAMAGLAMSGQTADAQRMMTRIQTLRPGYDLSSWAEGLLRRAPTHLSQSLVQGLRESEIL